MTRFICDEVIPVLLAVGLGFVLAMMLFGPAVRQLRAEVRECRIELSKHVVDRERGDIMDALEGVEDE